MGELQRAFDETLSKAAAESEWSDEELDDRTEVLYLEVLENATKTFLESLRGDAPGLLEAEEQRNAEFAAGNKLRWKPPLDELKMMLGVARDAGAIRLKEWNATGNEPYMLAALNHLYVKALQTTGEIICLIEGGYADGALARWRTLHELSVFAQLLFSSEEIVARRFLAAFDFRALKAANRINRHAADANLVPFSDQEIQELEECCRLHDELGPGLGAEYGWAKPRLSRARRLEDLEEATGLAHWRPRYQWASQQVHGGFRPHNASLGLAEAKQSAHLVGASNSGMVDPLHMTALSLLTASGPFLLRNGDMDGLVVIQVLSRIASDLGELALSTERETLRQFEAKSAGADSHPADDL